MSVRFVIDVKNDILDNVSFLSLVEMIGCTQPNGGSNICIGTRAVFISSVRRKTV